MALALGALTVVLFALGVLPGLPPTAGVVAWEPRRCWSAFSGALTIAGLAGGFLFGTASASALATVLSNVSLVFGVFSLPVSICIGILKYHLYDIDRIISRTLAYAIVTGLLIGVYAGLVLLATRVRPSCRCGSASATEDRSPATGTANSRPVANIDQMS